MRRLIDDESGMTLVLALIMIALIGVMGAGLLAFVSRDLNSVVEVNQGQRAQEMADIGLEAAKRQLTVVDALPSSYDAKDPGDNSEWYDDGTGTSGKTLNFGGNEILVSIRYLEISTTADEAREPDHAPEELPVYYKPDGTVDTCDDADGDGRDDDFELPEVGEPDVDACNYENNRNYFRVTVSGGSGEALRRIQAIYQTENYAGVPLSNYASRDIDFNGNATTVEDMSIFASRNLLNFRAERISGTDYAYGDWATIPGTDGEPNPHNATPRLDGAGNPVTAAGAGVVGSITYAPAGGGDKSSDTRQKAKTADPQRYGYRDYDTNTDLSPILRPEFRANTWSPGVQPSSYMTFPFVPATAGDDAQALATLKEKAQNQGLYVKLPPGGSCTIRSTGPCAYPSSSDLEETVMFIEFASGTVDSPVYGGKGNVTYQATSSDADNKVKGLIVVVHGNLNTNSSADTFQGAMLVRDGIDGDTTGATSAISCNSTTTSIMYFCNNGNVTIEGYVNVEGDMRLGGNISGLLPSELLTGLPSLVKVSLWSWQECYNSTCG